jgi:arylsulfatase A-like enzyme
MRRIQTAVSETDVMPTIVDLAGVAIPPSVDGISLKPLLEGTPAPARIVYAMNFENATAHSPLAQQRHSVALIDWPWKYVEYERVPQLSSELYDLAHDPSETSNLASAQPQLAQHYSTLMSRSIAASDARERK